VGHATDKQCRMAYTVWHQPLKAPDVQRHQGSQAPSPAACAARPPEECHARCQAWAGGCGGKGAGPPGQASRLPRGTPVARSATKRLSCGDARRRTQGAWRSLASRAMANEPIEARVASRARFRLIPHRACARPPPPLFARRSADACQQSRQASRRRASREHQYCRWRGALNATNLDPLSRVKQNCAPCRCAVSGHPLQTIITAH
jgi:hypothetical protein